jgi:hypothetical protein
MAVIYQNGQLYENPIGNGWVYRGTHLLTEVSYELKVFHNGLYNGKTFRIMITGTIKAINNPNILWGTDRLTLRLQDRRKLDFMCVDFNPECEITSDTDFYV